MKKTVLVTGVTGAIGNATALELARNNCNVILLARNPEKLSKVKSEIIQASGNKDIETVVADLSEPESIRKAAKEVRSKHNYLNALVNVAAIFQKNRTVNSGGLESMFATNHLGVFVLTNELLDLLNAGKPARILNVSAPSTTKIKFEDINGSEKFSAGFLGAFGASKMMNILFTYALARRIEGSGITANIYHPGLVKSDLTKDMPRLLYLFFKKFSAAPDKAAKMLCSLAIDPKFESANGKFFNNSGKEIKSSDYSYDKEIQERLWAVSEELTNK